MIDISKAQLEANLRATMQMREAAERAFHRVKEVLVDLALQFLIRLTSTAIRPPSTRHCFSHAMSTAFPRPIHYQVSC
jgi:hypothetical protein